MRQPSVIPASYTWQITLKNTPMKKTYKLITLCVLLFGGVLQLRAQDPEFTQFYANPLYLNPALAGTKLCPRVGLNYRNQWPGISGTYTCFSASYDQYVQGVKGGIGAIVFRDQAGENTLTTTGVGAIYNFIQPITKKVSISFAMQAGIWQKAVNWEKLTFGDMIDPRTGFIYDTDEQRNITSITNFDISTGGTLTVGKFYMGAAVHHLLEPNEAFLGPTSILPRKYTGHAGAMIPFQRNDKDSYISPNILYQQQGNFRQLNLGVYVKKEVIVGGLWYRNADSFVILLGIEKDLFKIGYSYDVTVSKLTNATAGSHEISLGKSFTCKKPKKKFRTYSCPSF